MIYKTSETGIEIDGVFYSVGMTIVGTNQSEYQGLIGNITEIRTDPDKDTENEGPDIYCTFEAPDDPAAVKELEAIFSDLYDEPKTIDDIILDEVIMAPCMIRASQ